MTILRLPQLPLDRIDDVVFAATAQVGDQGLTLGRSVALLAGLPASVPGFAVDRMCAGALTATTAGAGEIAMGAAEIVLVGGVGDAAPVGHGDGLHPLHPDGIVDVAKLVDVLGPRGQPHFVDGPVQSLPVCVSMKA